MDAAQRLGRQVDGPRLGVDAGAVEDLVGVDVADARDYPLVQQQRFESAAAQRALTRVTDAVLDKASKLFDDDKLREAYELTTLALKGAKNHARARELDDKVRNALAEKSFKRAQVFMERDKFGNALVELAACLTYRPDYPDGKLQFGQVKLRLEEKLRPLGATIERVTEDNTS